MVGDSLAYHNDNRSGSVKRVNLLACSVCKILRMLCKFTNRKSGDHIHIYVRDCKFSFSILGFK